MIYFIQNAVNYHIKIGFTEKPVRTGGIFQSDLAVLKAGSW